MVAIVTAIGAYMANTISSIQATIAVFGALQTIFIRDAIKQYQIYQRKWVKKTMTKIIPYLVIAVVVVAVLAVVNRIPSVRSMIYGTV